MVLPLGPIRPTIPTTSLPSMMGSWFVCQTPRPATPGASCVIVSLRRFGTPATTARCRTSSPTAANPVCSHADFVTAPPDPAVRKTRTLQGCRRATSSSRWPTTRAARSYMFRQLYDFRHGARTGEWSPLMVQAVATLDEQDLLAIVAYLASRDP